MNGRIGRTVLAVVVCIALGACGSGDGDSGSSLCAGGCDNTLAANCTNGPVSAQECEADCNALRTAGCGTEYETLLACAVDVTVTCGADGFPAIAGCAAEQAAFVACLSTQ